MSYSVDWSPEARAQLTTLWIQYASHRSAVTKAQARIDALLAADPLRNGIPLAEGLYAINVPPLRAVCEVSDVDQTVTVDSIRWSP